MESEAPAAVPELEGAAALPVFPQEAPQENEAASIWIVEDTNDLDDAGIRHKILCVAKGVVLGEGLHVHSPHETEVHWDSAVLPISDGGLILGLCILLGTSKHTGGRQSMMLLS